MNSRHMLIQNSDSLDNIARATKPAVSPPPKADAKSKMTESAVFAKDGYVKDELSLTQEPNVDRGYVGFGLGAVAAGAVPSLRGEVDCARRSVAHESIVGSLSTVAFKKRHFFGSSDIHVISFVSKNTLNKEKAASIMNVMKQSKLEYGHIAMKQHQQGRVVYQDYVDDRVIVSVANSGPCEIWMDSDVFVRVDAEQPTPNTTPDTNLKSNNNFNANHADDANDMDVSPSCKDQSQGLLQ